MRVTGAQRQEAHEHYTSYWNWNEVWGLGQLLCKGSGGLNKSRRWWTNMVEQPSTCPVLWVCVVVQQECRWQAILESKSLRQSADLVIAPWTRLQTSTHWFSSSCSLPQSSSSASVLISLATPPGRDRARMLWLTAAISTAREMGSWWSAWLPASSLRDKYVN